MVFARCLVDAAKFRAERLAAGRPFLTMCRYLTLTGISSRRLAAIGSRVLVGLADKQSPRRSGGKAFQSSGLRAAASAFGGDGPPQRLFCYQGVSLNPPVQRCRCVATRNPRRRSRRGQGMGRCPPPTFRYVAGRLPSPPHPIGLAHKRSPARLGGGLRCEGLFYPRGSCRAVIRGGARGIGYNARGGNRCPGAHPPPVSVSMQPYQPRPW